MSQAQQMFQSKAMKDAVRGAVKSALITGGSAVGTYLGGPSGASVGGYLGAGLSKLIGSGDYVSNDLIKKSKGGVPMSMLSKSDSVGVGKVRIRHREFIGEINNLTPGVFNIQSFPVQPGSGATFPWLSNLARTFERYKFNGLAFEFVSSTSIYGSTQNFGKIMMSAEYNVTQPNFSTARAMENSNECITFKPCDNAVYGIECVDTPQDRYFVAADGQSVSNPLVTTDMCNLLVGITSPLTGYLGDLWAVYDVELDRPHIIATDPTLSYAHISLNAPNYFALGSIYQTTFISNYGYSIGADGYAPVLNTIQFDVNGISKWDVFQVILTFNSDAAAVLGTFNITSVFPANLIPINYWDNNAKSQIQGPDIATGSTATTCITCRTFQFTGEPGFNPCTFRVVSAALSPGTPGNWDLTVVKIVNPGSLVTAPI